MTQFQPKREHEKLHKSKIKSWAFALDWSVMEFGISNTFSVMQLWMTLRRSHRFVMRGWSVLQLSQATQSHCCISSLCLQQLHGQTVSCDQPGLYLQLQDRKEFQKELKGRTCVTLFELGFVCCGEQCVCILNCSQLLLWKWTCWHTGLLYVATSPTVVMKISKCTTQHFLKNL